MCISPFADQFFNGIDFVDSQCFHPLFRLWVQNGSNAIIQENSLLQSHFYRLKDHYSLKVSLEKKPDLPRSSSMKLRILIFIHREKVSLRLIFTENVKQTVMRGFKSRAIVTVRDRKMITVCKDNPSIQWKKSIKEKR
jgi:hypothetical protein